jgi:hypothetical protein
MKAQAGVLLQRNIHKHNAIIFHFLHLGVIEMNRLAQAVEREQMSKNKSGESSIAFFIRNNSII